VTMSADPYESRARALLGTHPGGARLARAAFMPIHGGAYSRCWRADTADGPAFIRLAHPGASQLGADWVSEHRLLGLASSAGYAPVPWLAIPSAGLVVTEFIAGAAPQLAEVVAPGGLTRIGALLRGVHALEPAAGIRRLVFATQAGRLESQRPMDGAVERRLQERSRGIFARLDAAQRVAAPCHNDVHLANLIDDGRMLRLVDWEYGGVGDPIYDLAGFTSHHGLDADQVGLLIDAYGCRIEPARLSAACWAYDYVQWLWHRLAARLDGPVSADSAQAAAALARRLAEPP
jgi:aminoglycoside phosphotransferase (APT) family kinase protein